MATAPEYVVISLPPELLAALPTDPATRTEVLTIGLQQWRVRQALAQYRQGEGSLAYAAQQAGVSIRQMIALAYAHGLPPKLDPDWSAADLTLDEVAQL